MTRDNLYWLSHDQIVLFKTFRGTARMCKQTINHAVLRIKQLSSLLYDFFICHYSEYPTILDSCSNSSATERKGEKVVGNASAENMEGERKKQVNSYLLLVQKIMKEEASIYSLRPPTDPSSDGKEKDHLTPSYGQEGSVTDLPP
ncbi:hypothetical protein Lal_00038016 [Lupinus albus]|nr:hypothetical protein Lal_00038016 [Lupinus albus]